MHVHPLLQPSLQQVLLRVLLRLGERQQRLVMGQSEEASVGAGWGAVLVDVIWVEPEGAA